MIHSIDMDALSTKMKGESERACVILGASALHSSLNSLLRARLSDHADELLKNMGPLATFSAQIMLARALDLITKEAESDLDKVRKVRNDFAHSCDLHLDFNTQSIHDRCRHLKLADAFISGIEYTKRNPNNKFTDRAIDGLKDKLSHPRWRFQLTVNFLLQYFRDILDNAQNSSGLLDEVTELGKGMIIKIHCETHTSQQGGELDAASRRQLP